MVAVPDAEQLAEVVEIVGAVGDTQAGGATVPVTKKLMDCPNKPSTTR